MPADDIMAKMIPAIGVVAIAGRAPGFGAADDVWVHEVDDIADVAQQVFEIPLPFTPPGRPGRPGRELSRYRGASPSRYS